VELFAQAFWTQKAGNATAEYEDAVWPIRALNQWKGQHFRFAVADGATETSFSGIWARQLVRMFCSPNMATCSDFVVGLPATQRRWRSAVSWRSLPWYAEAKLEAGAFAALLGLELFDDREAISRGGMWQAIAIGDCCLVHMRGDQLLRSFPMENAAAFNNRPVLLSSNPTYNSDVAENLSLAQGRWIPDDAFYLMTDALAAWFLAQTEEGGQPWTILRDLDTHDQATDFMRFVHELRIQKLLRNDDVTLLRVDVL
jgi:hypothetical protein